MEDFAKGTLYVVATPIGNIADMVPRAVEILNHVDLILAEDTRHSRILLQHYGIETQMQSFHDFSGRNRVEQLIERLCSGTSMALISDSGTPLISDPGFELVNKALEKTLTVLPIPGPLRTHGGSERCRTSGGPLRIRGFFARPGRCQTKKTAAVQPRKPNSGIL